MRCPICKKPSAADKKILPFCSARCRDVDLYKWFSGSYSIPVVEYDDIDEEELEKLNGVIEEKDD
ncbi:MAG: DNA gyrase inhibitor YacG [Alphaproteobacteria bacterium]|nr:DNA gyrase inhibitor YacG [Alphaproteobacteria bacterium]